MTISNLFPFRKDHIVVVGKHHENTSGLDNDVEMADPEGQWFGWRARPAPPPGIKITMVAVLFHISSRTEIGRMTLFDHEEEPRRRIGDVVGLSATVDCSTVVATLRCRGVVMTGEDVRWKAYSEKVTEVSKQKKKKKKRQRRGAGKRMDSLEV